ncbi:protoporphyrinogen oxidase [Bacillus sp. AGMB 02131]|uniref:Coproporphyrinogen III oxidase n=1 Tax=Peribacillus faecalis TaxID=2772559 RepID=A0A927CYU9_9BACI|nr:protoporphyrinogen oxidase [Peribacillus faecalis]MBD3110222.1 protoporphyrinogen oxidase [Peribacillus faecalis]
MNAKQHQKVVIIGGGITGLTAAYYLQQEIKKQSLPIDVTLLEGSSKLGGKIRTTRRDGFIIENGPDCFLERKTSASKLIKEVGLEHELVNNTAGKSYVLAREKLYPMPGGSIMGIPTQIAPFITTGLFTPFGKLRAAGDFVLPKSKAKQDQPLGAFFRRRLGDEVVENLIEPLLSGIYAGDIDQMSLMSTFPEFYRVEQKYGSLVLGMKKASSVNPKSKSTKQTKKGMFLTLKIGLESLIDKLEDALDQVTVLKSAKVKSLFKAGEQYKVMLETGETLEADVVLCTVPHQAAASLLSKYSFMEPFNDVPSTSVATVAMAFDQNAIKKDINGTGFVISRKSSYTITACTWTHKKWPHSCPEGKALLRCYVGRPADMSVVDLSDEEIKNIVLHDLNKTMSITEQPEFTVVTRWKKAMPQYTVGHKQRIEQLKLDLHNELPGILLTGSSYEGLGIPDCISQGEAAVGQVLEYLQSNDNSIVIANAN